MQRRLSFFDGGNSHSTPYGPPITPASGAVLAETKHKFFPSPLNGVEFQPIETCPKNFIIFDQTENKSRVMFHPALAVKLNCPNNFNDCAADAIGKTIERNDEDEDQFSSLKEDTEDIDALLSSEEEEDEDDVVSTGRTPANWRSCYLDSSCSTERIGKRSTSQNSLSSDASSSSKSRRERMRKMVKVLRGIIPDGDQMDTSAVLDEAVNYLKSLKVEMKKLGMQDFKN